jgi:hypothetical protein
MARALEVVPEGEVAGHLEEGVVPGGDADLVDVRSADALLDAGGRGIGQGAPGRGNTARTGTMPALTNSRLGSSRITEALGTSVCPALTK